MEKEQEYDLSFMEEEQTKPQEVKENGTKRSRSKSSNGSTTGTKRNAGSGTESSSSRESSEPSGTESGGNKEGSTGSKTPSPADILSTIRNKRAKRTHDADAGKNEIDRGTKQQDVQGNAPSNAGNESNPGAVTDGDHKQLGRNNGRPDHSDGKPGNDRTNSETDSTRSRKRVKPKGVGVDLPPVVPQDPKATKPIMKPDEKVLTKTEGKELYDGLKASIKVILSYADLSISYTNKEKYGQPVTIWANVTDEELNILASAIIEAGYGSKIAATAVRRTVQNHRLLVMGQMSIPKFIQTITYYKENGIRLPFLELFGGIK